MGNLQYRVPEGAHVLMYFEEGGGQNCNCGPPTFRAPIYDPRFLAAGISEGEFSSKMALLNERLRQTYSSPIPRALALLGIMIACQVARSYSSSVTTALYALMFFSVIFFIWFTLRQAEARRAQIQSFFGDWTLRGVSTQYQPAGKHRRGTIYFLLPSQPMPFGRTAASFAVPMATAVPLGAMGVPAAGGPPVAVPIGQPGSGGQQGVPVASMAPPASLSQVVVAPAAATSVARW